MANRDENEATECHNSDRTHGSGYDRCRDIRGGSAR